MSDVVSEWLTNGPSGFGTLTQAILSTQNASEVSSVGIVASQQFLRALIDAATNGGTA